MRLIIFIFFSLLLTVKLDAQLLAGPYAPPAGQTGSTAIHKDSSIIFSWAKNAVIDRGWIDISNTSLGKTTAGNDTSATDKSGVNGVVSLGDGGMATLSFEGNIYDGPGPDFAVFENGFSGFLELAFVEVSSDGINFFRFEASSLTDTSIQTTSFGSTDATEIHNLAGKYHVQYGTPFDLNELAGTQGLDVNNISYVRVVDVVGNINSIYATYDAQNRAVNDPWPTAFATGGFDLDAIGVINATANGLDELANEIKLSLYPNPATNKLYVNTNNHYSYRIVDVSGKEWMSGQLSHQLDISHLRSGIYVIHVYSADKYVVKKIVKQ